MKNKCILGIDTSNYRTSVALVDTDNNIISSKRELLEVKKGERGLQQSVALFQHIKKLPILIDSLNLSNYEIVAVACSSRPRSVEGSYMPVFLAGETVAKSIASALGVPLYEFSHQDGHIAAANMGLSIDRYIGFHFSGGTTECLLCENDSYELVGGSLDLAIGQVIDRVGVKLGLPFPAGPYLDEMIRENDIELSITPVKVKDGYFNLSGLETQLMRFIENGTPSEEIAKATFDEIVRLINKVIDKLHDKYGVNDFVFAGGVSSSQYIRKHIDNKYRLHFVPEALSGDNAVGIALLGGKEYGKEASNHITTE